MPSPMLLAAASIKYQKRPVRSLKTPLQVVKTNFQGNKEILSAKAINNGRLASLTVEPTKPIGIVHETFADEH